MKPNLCQNPLYFKYFVWILFLEPLKGLPKYLDFYEVKRDIRVYHQRVNEWFVKDKRGWYFQFDKLLRLQ